MRISSPKSVIVMEFCPNFTVLAQYVDAALVASRTVHVGKRESGVRTCVTPAVRTMKVGLGLVRGSWSLDRRESVRTRVMGCSLQLVLLPGLEFVVSPSENMRSTFKACLCFSVTFGRESVPLDLLRDVVERASSNSAAKSLLLPRQWVSTAVFLDFGSMLESQFPDLSVGSSFGFPSPSTKLHHFHRIVFTRPLLLFPVVESGHWTLLRVVVHGGNQFRVTLFDPYGQSPSSFEELEVAFGDYFRRCIVDEKFRLKSRTLFSVADWRNVLGSMSFALVHARIPRQEDGQTCGLRALFYMELMAKNPDERSVDELTHDNSPDFWDLFRKWILYSLYCQATKQ